MDNDTLCIYLSMGFDAALAERACALFDKDVEKGSEWILHHTTLGEMPKRFKDGKSDDFVYTFYNSELVLDSVEFTVSDYDARYNIIEIQPADRGDPRWISLSHPNIRWHTVRHASKRVFKKADFGVNFYVGDVYLPTDGAFLEQNNMAKCHRWYREFNSATENGVGHLPQMFSRSHCHLVENKALASLWYSFLCFLDKKHNTLRITPDFPEPRFPDSQAVRNLKTKMWTKMILIMEIEGIPKQRAHDALLSDDARTAICGLGMTERSTEHILALNVVYNAPREHLLKKRKEWLDGCTAMFKIKDPKFHENTKHFEGKLYMSTNIFTNMTEYDTVHWIHTNRIFHIVKWGSKLLHDTDKCIEEISSPIQMHEGTLADWGKMLLSWCENQCVEVVNTMPSDAKPHQTEAIQWMLNHEWSSIRNPLPMGWEEMPLKCGVSFFLNRFGNLKQSPWHNRKIVYGGVVAQPSGSGKTFNVIQVIKHMQSCTEWLCATLYRQTLIVVEQNNLAHWVEEFQKWAPEISLTVYHGRKRTLTQSQVVLTTYRIVASECSFGAPVTAFPFRRNVWRRIVLDNGPRNAETILSRAIRRLRIARHGTKFICTTTPVVKNLQDMVGYYTFLGIYPWNPDGSLFRSAKSLLWAMALTSEGHPNVMKAFKSMNQQIVFYQSLEQVKSLTSDMNFCIHETCSKLTPTASHSRLLTTLHTQLKSRRATDVNRYYFSQMRHWLRIAALSPTLVPSVAYGEPAQSTSGIIMKTSTLDNLCLNDTIPQGFIEALKKEITEKTCPICLCPPEDLTVTHCGHVFCNACILQALESNRQKKCPVCRAPLYLSVLQTISEEEVVEKQDDVLIQDRTFGAANVPLKILDDLETCKTEENVKCGFIQDWLFKHKEKKVIIISHYVDALELIHNAVVSAGLKALVASGKKRHRVVETFCEDPAVPVLICLDKIPYQGNKLTKISSIIYFDPCHNKDVYQENINKLSRLGQVSKNIDVVTLALSNSCEHKIYNSKKRKILFRDII